MTRRCSNQLPLLTWPRDRQVLALEQKRQQMIDRIKQLPPNSHRCIGLREQLRMLTDQILRLESRS